MSLFEIVVAAILVTVFLGVVVYRVLKSTAHGRRFLKLPTRAKVRFGRNLLTDPEIPWPAKAAMALAVGYLALPFDLIPDFIPVVGQLDDLVVVGGLLLILMAAVPKPRFEAALVAAEGLAEGVGRSA